MPYYPWRQSWYLTLSMGGVSQHSISQTLTPKTLSCGGSLTNYFGCLKNCMDVLCCAVLCGSPVLL